jgi:hypothetical protein
VTFGFDGTTGEERPAAAELVRLAPAPTGLHLEPPGVRRRGDQPRPRESVRGLRITAQQPMMRNFTASFSPCRRLGCRW